MALIRELSKDQIPLMGVCVHLNRLPDDTVIQKLLDLKVKIVRRDLDWHRTESAKGVYNFSYFDTLHNKLVANGIKTVILLGKGNALYGQAWDQPPTTTAGIDAMAKWAQAVAKRYGPDQIYELYNEPNLTTFWPSGPNPQQFATLVNRVAAAIKAIHPNAVVVTGGVAAAQGLKAEDFIKAAYPFLDKTKLNAIGTHPYTASDKWESNPLDEIEAMDDRNKLMQSVAGGMQVFGTESGIWLSKCDGATRAEKLKRQGVLTGRWVLASLMWPQPWNMYYDLVDDGTDPANDEHNFGLVSTTGAMKPAGEYFKKLNDILQKADKVTLSNEGEEFKAIFNVPDGTWTVEWNDTSDLRYTFVPTPIVVPPPPPAPVDTSKTEALVILDTALETLKGAMLDQARLTEMVVAIQAAFQILEKMRTEAITEIEEAKKKLI